MNSMPDLRITGNTLSNRVRIMATIMVMTMLVLLVNLWRLQVLWGDEYDEKSKSNRIRVLRLPAPRGTIVDSAGRVLAENRPGFQFSIMSQDLDNPGEFIDRCSALLGTPPEKLRSMIEKSRSLPRFVSYPVKKNLTLEEMSLIQTLTADLKGTAVDVRPFRHYPRGETLCHVIGTVGEISANELANPRKAAYRMGDSVGKSGIEKEYESHLRGEEGWEQIEIDARGRQLSEMVRQPPRPGSEVTLTVDAEFQAFVEDIFIHRAGSVVAIDPESGHVLAMVSKPGYDLNVFSPVITEKYWKSLNNDPLHPLENRSVRGLYAPGSTFKIVTASAALAERVVGPARKFLCTGELEIGGIAYRCWNERGHGQLDFHRAMVESCDVYFYELGKRLGSDKIAKWASLFGLGKPTGIGLPQELPGLVPTNIWKTRVYGEPIKDGETVSIAIGQGFLLTTPLQLAVMTAALANGGKILAPSIVQKISSPDGNALYEHATITRWVVPLSDEHTGFLRDSLKDVVQDRRGTGRKAFVPGINVKGKTGTTQVISTRDIDLAPDQVPYHERTHAIFVAYVDDMPKKIALAVVVEHGGGGGATAAPIARKIIARYYGVKDPGEPRE